MKRSISQKKGMKVFLKTVLAMVLAVAILLPVGLTNGVSAAEMTSVSSFGSVSSALDDKTEELAKKLAESGIKKGIGKIPVIGKTLESAAGPYIKKLLGIKEGESTNAKLDKMNKKLDDLMKSVEENSQNEMKKIYESKFNDFHDRLMAVKNKSSEYLTSISKYEKNSTCEEDKLLRIAGLTSKNPAEFSTYLDNITAISQYVTGDVVEFHHDGDIYTKAFRVYCDDVSNEYGCALGGEAAMKNAEYVNAINEIVDTAHTTASLMIFARYTIGNDIENYKDLQSQGTITSDVSLADFNPTDADNFETKYDIVKNYHYAIFGVDEEDIESEREALEEGEELTLEVSPGVIGNYNKMIEDRWFDYFEDVDFSGNVPVVNFVPMDGEIGFAGLEKYGFDRDRALSLSEDSAVSFCKTISSKALADKRSALTDEQFNKLMKHIEVSENFHAKPEYEGADLDDISLRDALVQYGFSFDKFDSGIYAAPEYTRVFLANAKCIEDYENSDMTHDAWIDGYVYGIDYNTLTKDMNGKSGTKSYQYFKGFFSSHSADKRSIDFPAVSTLYFTSTVKINTLDDFKNFIRNIAAGNNYAGKTVLLNCDLNLKKVAIFDLWPWASVKKEFCGTFDGQGHTVSGLRLSSGEHRVALFRTTGDGAIIKNLVFEDVQIENTAEKNGYAALVGYANGNLTVDNVAVNTGYINGWNYVGGIVGEVKRGKYVVTTLNHCVNNVPITSRNADAGGMIGNGAGIDLYDCVNNGTVTATKGAAGGIAGYLGDKDTDPRAIVETCKNFGTIVGYDCAGGICGHIQSDNGNSVIGESTNEGSITVTGKRSAGGIVGRTCTGGIIGENVNKGTIINKSNGDDSEAGGILGENEDDGITLSYNENSGTVTGNKRAGGIAGTLGDRDHDKVCQIYGNVNSGNVTSNGKDAGGICGAVATDNKSHSIYENSNSGVIVAKSEAGGIVGWMAGGGLFDNNTNTAAVTSVSLNAGGLVGRIQDDLCNFKASNVGNPFAGAGTVSPEQSAGFDYVINARASGQHAGLLCGWDGKKNKVINADTFSASIFGNGKAGIVVAMGLFLVFAAVVVGVVYRRKNDFN